MFQIEYFLQLLLDLFRLYTVLEFSDSEKFCMRRDNNGGLIKFIKPSVRLELAAATLRTRGSTEEGLGAAESSSFHH